MLLENKYKKSRWLIFSLALLILACVSVLTLELAGVTNFYQRERSAAPTPQSDQPTINYGPATDEEKQQAEDNKKRIEETGPTEDNQPTSNSSLKQVKPVITSAGQYDNAQYGSAIEVRTLVTGVYENRGTCTATFTLNSQKFERKVEAIQDATTTRCDVVFIPRSEFPSAGIWDLVVNYTSPAAYGNSDVSKVEVK